MTIHSEQDFRLEIVDSFLKSPHRKVEEIIPTHAEALKKDPLFYGHLAVWAQENLAIRDQKEVFISHLFASELPEHREAAFCLLESFPPYQVNRIVNHLKEKMKKDKGKSFNPPRILRTAVRAYLEKREADLNWFDSLALRQRKDLTALFSRFRIKPNERSQKILFDREPPEDSRVYQLGKIIKEKDPAEQAKMIVQFRIPYPIASSVIHQMTPSILVALIEVMSSQELLSQMNALKKQGAFNNEDVKELVKRKLGKAKTGKRVDALKGKKAAEMAGVSEDLKHELEEVTEAKIKSIAIKRSTALLIDKSGSMERAIELGKQVGSIISAGISADFFCYAFDTMAYPIELKSNRLEDWEKALKYITAGGGTSIGCAVDMLMRKNQKVEQIVVITDQGENRFPYFREAYLAYKENLKVTPDVVVLTVPASSEMGSAVERACTELKINCDKIEIPASVDYYSLPSILTILSRKSRFDLLAEIMNTPLPKRAEKRKVKVAS